MANKIRYVALALLLAASVARGQGVLEGVVTDPDGAKKEFVNVGVPGLKGGVVTNNQGFYRLQLPSDDSLRVSFSYMGFEPQEYLVFLKKGETRVLNVQLKPVARVLQEVKVQDDKVRQSTFTRIGVEKLDHTVGPSSAVESLIKTLPDVGSSNELSNQYSVRGGSFDENLVYINGIEVFRPMLIRNGQQEGMSIINADLVDNILFSPGGFDAVYGDKMSSVLDINYVRPQQFSAKVSGSFLGASASVQGMIGQRFSYGVSFRQHSNQYVFRTLDTKGQYTTSYRDLQALLGYKLSEKTDLGGLLILTRNVYGLIPESETTTFGGYAMPMTLKVFFDGQEQDRYNTLLGAATITHRPNEHWLLKGALSVQHINENERYDVQSQYWLYELGMGETSGDTVQFDRGVGTFLEHASNRLATNIVALDFNARRNAMLGNWSMGLKLQMEQITDHLREWKWVDSAGYSMPVTVLIPGDTNNGPVSPSLQQYSVAENWLNTWRGTMYLQRELNFVTRRDSEIKVLAGVRGLVYTSTIESNGTQAETGLIARISPRASVNYKPRWDRDLVLRLAGGVYNQPPFYREYRRMDGSLAADVRPQTSYQITGTADKNVTLWHKNGKIIADIYYKYITDLIPYTVDNLRLRYMPDAKAKGYAYGISLRVNCELFEDVESWASLSLMRTQEDIEGDGLGWLDRPTDQRLSFKMFLQDYVPDVPWWRMSLNLIVATGMPVAIPMAERTEQSFRLPTYFRVDWGNTVQLSRIDGLKNRQVFKNVKDILLAVEVFNLFNYRNVASYLWVSDYDNIYYPVPNYLTGRQLNLKCTILF